VSASVELPQGTIRYTEAGRGEPIVFVHGFLVDGALWRDVVPLLERGFRCIVPDLPLGSHRVAMRADADLSPPGMAAIVDGFMGALGLERVTLVGNDTGGAICQLVAVNHPARLARLVLTPCDAYENFLPPAFRYLQLAAAVPGGIAALMQSMRLRAMRRAPIAFGWLTKRRLPDDLLDRWVEPILTDREVRRDAVKLLRGISKRYTLDAAERLTRFDRPALIAWAPEDRFFKLRYGERLAATIPNARLERIEDARTFVSLDQPRRVAELIEGFARG
jgi:pimeloyl-ACP methyl ester carboxylesterase